MSISSELVARYKTDVFIETGSYEGGTIQKALDAGVKEIHSIEINPQKFKFCCARFANEPRVNLYLGDTIDILPEIINKLSQRATFWLDAHAGNGASGRYSCPLIQELKAFISSPIKDHIILIDDRRLLGSAAWGRVTEEQVLAELKSVNSNYTIVYEDGVVPNDIIVATL